MLKVGDVVRIAYQPENQHVGLVGQVGHIQEIKNGWVNFETFDLNGRMTGSGSVPTKSLVPEPGEVWRRAKKALDASWAAACAASEAYDKRWNKLLTEVAKKHKISKTKALKIYQELSRFVDR